MKNNPRDSHKSHKAKKIAKTDFSKTEKSAYGETGDDVYNAWYKTLPKEQRVGLPEPMHPLGIIDSNYIFEVQPNHSAFGFKENNAFDDPEALPKRLYDQDEVENIIRRVVMAMQLSESPEVLFQSRCILIAFGMGDPPTETELSRIKGCSRQFVSKKVKRIQQLFNLSPSQYMRSEEACKAYAKAWKKANKGDDDEGGATAPTPQDDTDPS
jgi:hypothetical protein